MLDAISGQPVLMRAPNVVDHLRAARLSLEDERQQMHDNARQAKLLPPPAEPPAVRPSAGPDREGMVEGVWAAVQEMMDDGVVEAVHRAVEQEEWASARRAIRTWLTQHRSAVNPLLEQTIFAHIAERSGDPDAAAQLEAFRQVQ